MAEPIRQKQKRVREQGYAAARQGKIYPRELQNTREDDWEDAKIYSMNTRQGQNYWQGHMQDRGEELKRIQEEKRKKKRNAIVDRLLRK